MSEPSETPCPKKPRRETQFKPGQSGNPLGRPKCKLDMSVVSPLLPYPAVGDPGQEIGHCGCDLANLGSRDSTPSNSPHLRQ
jgi:hypothetical protein